jgi:hypothetical protein
MSNENLELRIKEKIGEIKIADVNALEIKSQGDMTLAQDYIDQNKAVLAIIDQELKPAIAQAYDLHKTLKAQQNKWRLPFESNIQVVESKRNTYYLEQKRIERETQEKAEAEARREEARQRELLLSRAAKAEEKGKTEKAEELLEQAQQVFIPVNITPITEKRIESESGKTTMIPELKIAVIDGRKVLRAVLDGTLPMNCIEIDYQGIKRAIKANLPADFLEKDIPAQYRNIGLDYQVTFSSRTTKNRIE